MFNDWCQVVTEQKTVEAPQLHCSYKVVDVPVVQFIDGCGRRCDHAATSGLLLEVPQTQFIARVRGHSSCTTATVTMLSAVWVVAAMKGIFVLFRPFFALLRFVPELSASFLSPR